MVTPSHDEQVARIRALAERVVRSHDFDLFDLQLRRESIGWVLRVVIDLPPPADPAGVEPPDAGVGVADCQRVSEDLSAALDVEDLVEHAYTLEVSSPGLDRPLRGRADYRRFAGRLARIVVSEAIDGQKHFTGRLQGVEEDLVILRAGQRTHRIPLPSIARARLEVEI